MNRKTSQYAKGLIAVLLVCWLFVAGIFLEESLRAAKTVSIPVDSSQVPEVMITASRKPDFLWVGTEWWIDYESPVPFDLDIGSGRPSKVPAGTHKIFSNHDYSNLGHYGLSLSKDFPEAIVVQQSVPSQDADGTQH